MYIVPGVSSSSGSVSAITMVARHSPDQDDDFVVITICQQHSPFIEIYIFTQIQTHRQLIRQFLIG
jgi:hypothetical protein